MKKLYFSCFVLLICLQAFSANINKTYYFDRPVVVSANEYQLITFENLLVTGLTGEPALPYQAINLLLPPGEEAIRVNIRFEDEVALDGTFFIYPQQSSRPTSMQPSGTFSINESVYARSEAYPSDPMGHYSTYFLNGHSVLLSTFTPVKYIPSTGRVTYYRKAIVEVTTRTTDRAMRALENLGTAPCVSRVREMVSNTEMLSSYPVKHTRDEGYQILVITPQEFVGDFDDYKFLYLNHGMKTEVATTESIDLTIQGADLQEKIRNYIIQEYQNEGIEYVLLGGDVEHIPYRGFYCYVVSGGGYEDNGIPADLYYSALDGNWNTNGDNKWGEIGEDDLLPDVGVTRWPFSNASQLQRMMHKTALYQDAPITGELQRPLLAGENLWSDPLTYGCDYLELLVGHHEDNGYTTDGIPETDDILYLCDEDAGWSMYDIFDAVNEGRNFIHHSGHANTTYVMRMDISDVNNENFSQVNGIDHNYTLVYTHGCLDGAFDYNDCIGEAMVLINNFAVAGAFNSRYGWFNEGQTEGPSAHLHREFVDALYDQQKNRIGATHMISKINTSTWVNAPGQWEEGALRWCFYDCNIFGDPALAIWTTEPTDFDVQYPEEIIVGATSFTVSVTSNGSPAEGMMCVIMSGETMTGCSVTDNNGQAVIQMPAGFAGDVAELVVSGYMAVPQHFPLSVQVGCEDLVKHVSLVTYPVPFDHHLTISLFSDKNVIGTLSFSMTDGRQIRELPVTISTGTAAMTFDTSAWPAGVIVMRLSNSSGTITRKLIHLGK
jgi:hypothetical protein